MRVIVDAFGGDNAPLEILKGCSLAVAEYGVEVTLTGKEDVIKKVAKENNISLDKMDIVDCPDVFEMEMEAMTLKRTMSNSSLAVGLKLVAEGKGDAFVSAGSTAGIVVGATLFVRRLPGVKRPALATVIPGENGPFLLLDCGANSECRPEMLEQFAILGSVYMEKVLGEKEPLVGLVNIGKEETKGNKLQLETYELLKNAPVNFGGNIEAREIPEGNYKVVVCDGFTGNIVLKLTEGVAKYLTNNIKKVFMKNIGTKVAALLVKGGLREFKANMDYSEHGGAPLLGTAKPVIKAHGSSNAKAIKNAIRQAKAFCDNEVIDKTKETLAKLGGE